MSAFPKERNVSLSPDQVNGILQVNKMMYKMPPNLVIASHRQYQTGFPQQSTSVPGDTMIFDLQTGSSFVDSKTSYLRFKITTTAVGDFGQGSAVNLFDRVTIRSRTGEELTRLEGANLITAFRQRYECPRDWFDTVGCSQGYPDAGLVTGTSFGNFGDGASSWLAATGGCVFVVPMRIFPFFDQEKLLPPQIMEGLRLEIHLAPASEALFSAAAPTYTLSGIQAKWDIYNVGDAYKRKINEMAASEGLTLLHKEYYRTLVSGNTSNYDFDVKKACSKALMTMAIPRLTANLQLGTVDSMIADVYSIVSQQLHIGSVYWPNTPLTNEVLAPATIPNQATINESYLYTISTFRALSCKDSPDVDNKSFMGAGAEPRKFGIASAWLGQSQVSDLMGQMINNSRSLLYELRFGDASARRLDVYLKHVRAVHVFVSNVEVRD